jgi:hypothetical protein
MEKGKSRDFLTDWRYKKQGSTNKRWLARFRDAFVQQIVLRYGWLQMKKLWGKKIWQKKNMLEEERKRGETSKNQGKIWFIWKRIMAKQSKHTLKKKMQKNEKTKYPACFGSNKESWRAELGKGKCLRKITVHTFK